jgi:hypothetical protein
VSCFDVTPDFGMAFEYQRSENPIKYMEVGFNPDQRSGDFFIEFGEQIHDNEVELCFDAQRAKGINVLTFPNDGGKAASDALLHVMALQNKYGAKITRGVFPSSLKKVFEEQKAAQDKLAMEREFSLKTQAAEKISLEEFKSEMGKVHDQVQVLGHFQKGIKDDMQSIGNDVQSYGVKMEAGLEDVKQGVCSVMPELHERIKQLEKEVEYHKTQRDSQEGRTAVQTGRVNKLRELVAAKDQELSALRKREDGLLERIKELETTLQVYKAIEQLKDMTHLAQEERAFARTERAELKQSIAEVQESAKSLGFMLALEEERAAKRQRF